MSYLNNLKRNGKLVARNEIHNSIADCDDSELTQIFEKLKDLDLSLPD